MTAFDRRQNFSRTVLGGSLATRRQEEEREALLKLIRFVATIVGILISGWVAVMVAYVFLRHAGYEIDTHALVFRPLRWIFG